MVKFIKVRQSDIDESERKLGFTIPKSLKEFYLKYGYGNIPSQGYNSNLLMHPVTAANFRLHTEEFDGFPDIELYDDYNRKYFVFFEANESLFFAVPLNGSSESVFAGKVKVANSIPEFIFKIIENEDYYLPLISGGNK
ncbi:MAG: SMI1/KNR4 family protein [Mogibacterium sp.]|nr:SMI1/KNR4 family protein [Mogibacterium sp.]